MNWMYVKALIVKYRRYMVSSKEGIEEELDALLRLTDGLGADRKAIAEDARVAWYTREIARIDTAISWMEDTYANKGKRNQQEAEARRTTGKRRD